ncbi:MAG: N,N-dimethylformamidase beta subunit family domain-containing protein [Acidimicrobiales bacterium]|jgi:hypothetical protein
MSGLAACLASLAVLAAPSGVGAADLPSSSGGIATPTRVRATFQGPAGVEARWVLVENKKKGTTAWRIPATAPSGAIAGFASTDDAVPGQWVTFRVTTPSPTFSVVAYRMGWYGGTGARAIWVSPRYQGTVQPACTFTAGVNLVSCANWSPSFSVRIGTAFVQGDYLFKLTASTGQESFVPLTVSDPTSKATYLLIHRTFTEEGWNAWGGYDFYQGQGSCVPTYPVCSRARVVSYDRPFDTGNGASDFLGNEYPLVQLMEREDLDIGYVTDTALDADPKLELGHKALLSLGHDETWSTPERQGTDAALSAGTNIVFFGAAAVLRHVRMEPSSLGPERLEVDYRDSDEDPLNGTGNPLDVTGNTFASPPTNWSEVTLTGEEYAGYLNGTANVPFVVYDAGAFVFKDTGLKDGDKLGGVVMSDFDHLAIGAGSPQGVEVLGHSPIPASLAYTNEGTWNGQTFSDMTYYTDATGGGVLDTGTVNWIYSLDHCAPGLSVCQSHQVSQITANILRVFGQGPAGLRYPSQPNWQGLESSES